MTKNMSTSYTFAQNESISPRQLYRLYVFNLLGVGTLVLPNNLDVYKRQKFHIAKEHLVEKQKSKNGIKKEQLTITDSALKLSLIHISTFK